ncbi:outer membrane receptor for ferric coprogen and ferric-rhodotorulic acid [Pseudoduganella lurida]|uniref:Outer membrane receptor for ferric coprogen and ferric-rhodotorulic acid n=1 Tax=Pseudoduganella lurida TaxID=1036180 RepID=A0A562QWK4_9BURK|nr:outer membrane receptor for ferric coprogen and ferric-rhodotorulic acid [Pseudoduganella lurida]
MQKVVIAGDRPVDSYTVDEVSIGKGQRTLRETPQSVSVLTRQRLEDQDLRTLDEALQAVAGITVETGSSYERTFYSRGFAVDTIQYDGVATLRGNGFAISPDLSVFETVEVQRGPAGLFNGSGGAGGTVNLVRKRPLKSNQLQGRLSAGRWDNYRAEGDASLVLNEAGTLRARAVVAHEDRDYFYDVANSKRTVGYAIVEADLGDATTLGAGVQYERNDMVPFYGGLPRYSDGRDLHLPRSTFLNGGWSHTDIRNTTVFADLNHQFNADWKLRIAGTRMREDNTDFSGSAFGPVNPATSLGPSISAFHQNLQGKQGGADATLEGSFVAFGRKHDVIVGANWQKREYDKTSQLYAVPNPIINPFTFDSRTYASVPTDPARAATQTLETIEQSGLYASLRLALAEQWKLVLGGRVSNWETATRNLVTNAYSTQPYKEDGEFTPYAALSWDLARDWTSYLSYAEIFRSQANLYTASGDRLDAATGSNYEAGIKGALYGGRLNAALALFRLNEDNRSQVDAGHPTPCAGSPTLGACYVAEGRVRSQGLDAELSGAIVPGVQLSGGYTYNETRFVRDRAANGTPSANENQPLLTFAPRHMARLFGTWKPAGTPWTVGGGVRSQSKTYKTSGVLRLEQGVYSVWTATAAYQFNRNLALNVVVNNLFDKTYYRTLGSTSGSNWYGEPRNITATLQATY